MFQLQAHAFALCPSSSLFVALAENMISCDGWPDCYQEWNALKLKRAGSGACDIAKNNVISEKQDKKVDVRFENIKTRQESMLF